MKRSQERLNEIDKNQRQGWKKIEEVLISEYLEARQQEDGAHHYKICGKIVSIDYSDEVIMLRVKDKSVRQGTVEVGLLRGLGSGIEHSLETSYRTGTNVTFGIENSRFDCHNFCGRDAIKYVNIDTEIGNTEVVIF